MMKAPWKILLNVCTDNRTFYIGNRYIYAYDVKQHHRMKYKLDDNWKVVLTALGQSEAMAKDPAQVMSTVLKFFHCVDKNGSFDPRDYFRECKIVCVNRYCMNLLYAPYWGKQR